MTAVTSLTHPLAVAVAGFAAVWFNKLSVDRVKLLQGLAILQLFVTAVNLVTGRGIGDKACFDIVDTHLTALKLVFLALRQTLEFKISQIYHCRIVNVICRSVHKAGFFLQVSNIIGPGVLAAAVLSIRNVTYLDVATGLFGYFLSQNLEDITGVNFKPASE